MADSTEENEDLEFQPKKSPLVLIIIIVNVVLVGGGVAAFLLLGGSGEASAEAETASAEAAPVNPGDDPGPMVDLPPFVVNLSDNERAHYLKVAVSLELNDEAAKARYEPRKTHARHVILMTLSSLTLEETRDIDNREQIRERLHDELQKVMGTRTIRSVYFTDFVTQ